MYGKVVPDNTSSASSPFSLSAASSLIACLYTSEWDQILELREAIATLTSRCKSLEERYDAFEARLVDLATKLASLDTKPATLIEG